HQSASRGSRKQATRSPTTKFNSYMELEMKQLSVNSITYVYIKMVKQILATNGNHEIEATDHVVRSLIPVCLKSGSLNLLLPQGPKAFSCPR
ncbi:hypothetical protein L9F63_006543, partial [Diploptera punctata]